MPLVVFCGIPCSGKSQRSRELVEFVTRNHPDKACAVHVVSDTEGDGSARYERDALFTNPRLEREQRGRARSHCQRLLTRDTIVILDAANYIKGYRYELFCIAKATQTPHCVVHLDTNVEVARRWNAERRARASEQSYSDDTFDELVMRFEAPNSQNRWDRPLFTVPLPDEALPCADILSALLDRRALPPPNMSTQSQPISATHFLQSLNAVSQRIVSRILEEQRLGGGCACDGVALPESRHKLTLARPYTMGELRKLKQQFISYAKTRPGVNERSDVGTLFVQFLNNSCS